MTPRRSRRTVLLLLLLQLGACSRTISIEVERQPHIISPVAIGPESGFVGERLAELLIKRGYEVLPPEEAFEIIGTVPPNGRSNITEALLRRLRERGVRSYFTFSHANMLKYFDAILLDTEKRSEILHMRRRGVPGGPELFSFELHASELARQIADVLSEQFPR